MKLKVQVGKWKKKRSQDSLERDPIILLFTKHYDVIRRMMRYSSLSDQRTPSLAAPFAPFALLAYLRLLLCHFTWNPTAFFADITLLPGCFHIFWDHGVIIATWSYWYSYTFLGELIVTQLTRQCDRRGELKASFGGARRRAFLVRSASSLSFSFSFPFSRHDR